jgi:hypothetical protein
VNIVALALLFANASVPAGACNTIQSEGAPVVVCNRASIPTLVTALRQHVRLAFENPELCWGTSSLYWPVNSGFAAGAKLIVRDSLDQYGHLRIVIHGPLESREPPYYLNCIAPTPEQALKFGLKEGRG